MPCLQALSHAQDKFYSSMISYVSPKWVPTYDSRIDALIILNVYTFILPKQKTKKTKKTNEMNRNTFELKVFENSENFYIWSFL